MKALEVKDLWFSYGDEDVLKGVNFSVDEGEMVAILGPNGAGKTTLLKLILGLLKPRRGEVRIFGLTPERARGLIGYVPQNLQPNRRMPITAFSVVMMGLYEGMLKWPGKTQRMEAEKVLEEVGISSLKKKLFGELSGGQRQRVLIARALVRKPKLLILDEPETGLDPSFQEGFYKLLQKIREKYGTTIITVTHDVMAVSQVVSSIACLNRTMVVHGRPHEVLTGENLKCLYGEAAAYFGHGPAPHLIVEQHRD